MKQHEEPPMANGNHFVSPVAPVGRDEPFGENEYTTLMGEVNPPKGWEGTEKQRRFSSSTNYSQNVFRRSRPTKLLVSSKGYIGLAHREVRKEDQICIFLGASVLPYSPCVSMEVGKARCRLIGKAYVHGLMKGQYMNQNPPVQTFMLV